MIGDNQRRILRNIAERLDGIDWVIVGGSALALQGIEADFQDIDIQTARASAEAIDDRLSDFVVQPLEYSKSELFSSYFGVYKIEDVVVEVMGDLFCMIQGEWVSGQRFIAQYDLIDLDGCTLRVERLEDLLAAYKSLGREKDQEKIWKILDFLRRKDLSERGEL